MKISYNWLRELTNTALMPQELATRLTSVGLAVDAVRQEGDDHILEFDLTSNRPDCLSHLGVAREVAVIEKRQAHLPATGVSNSSGRAESFTSVEVHDPVACPRYTARVVRGVRVAPSPDWLANRLHAIGLRPINNIADITNYVLIEMGQPLHAFDLAKLVERRIVVRRAWAKEKIRTLDGVERELDEEMLVIADATRAVGIAGVMGGEETEISAATRDVLIESAYFDPASVRRTSRVLGLQTDASYRFERGVDYEGVRRAQDRAVALICELAGGTASENAIDVYPQPIEPPIVNLRFKRIEDLTGLRVEAPEAIRILTALGFAVHDGERKEATSPTLPQNSGGTDSMRVRSTNEGGAGGKPCAAFIAPTWRVDIEREEDLVEEVARHVGYDKIAFELPASNIAGEYRAGEMRRRAARLALTASGFDEAINFSFGDAAHGEQFELLPSLVVDNGDSARFITLSNPIIEGATLMRPSLLPGLLSAVRHNINHGTRDVRLFEMGRVFAAPAHAGERPTEREALSLVITGGLLEEGRAGARRELDLYDLKGPLEAAADAMKIPALEFEAASIKHLHQGQAARVMLEGLRVGTLGRLAEAVAGPYKFRQPVFVAEVDFSALLEAGEVAVRYTPLARYPSILRDISITIDRRITFAEIRRAVVDLSVENCRAVRFVDVYEGAGLPEGKRSVTLRIEYRADDRTLRDEEVDALHNGMVGALLEGLDAQLRQ